MDVSRLMEAARDRDSVKQAIVEILHDMVYLDSCDNAECAMLTSKAYDLLRKAVDSLDDAREIVSRFGRAAGRKGG